MANSFGLPPIAKGRPSKPRFRRRLGSPTKSIYAGGKPQVFKPIASPLKPIVGTTPFPGTEKDDD